MRFISFGFCILLVIWNLFIGYFLVIVSWLLYLYKEGTFLNPFKRTILILLLCAMCVSSSGCASLLQAPLALIKLPFQILSQALKFAAKMPKPPPGVFF